MNLDIFCNKVGIEKELLIGKSRKAWINNIRQVYCFVCREKYNMTLEQIGLNINRSHATVIHSVNKVKELLGVKDKNVLLILEFIGYDS